MLFYSNEVVIYKMTPFCWHVGDCLILPLPVTYCTVHGDYYSREWGRLPRSTVTKSESKAVTPFARGFSGGISFSSRHFSVLLIVLPHNSFCQQVQIYSDQPCSQKVLSQRRVPFRYLISNTTSISISNLFNTINISKSCLSSV